jgi:MFS family permease
MLTHPQAASLSVANLYYTHPILNILAEDFGVSDERSSLIPTIMQAGYAGGLLFLIPVGDIVRRRPMILGLILATSLFVSNPSPSTYLEDDVADQTKLVSGSA